MSADREARTEARVAAAGEAAFEGVGRPVRTRLPRSIARSALRRPERKPPKDDLRDILEGQRTPSALRRDSRLRRALGFADAGSALAAIAAALAASGQPARPGLIFAPVLIVVLCKLAGLYERDEHVMRKSTLDQAPAILQITTMYSLLIWFGSELFVSGGFAKADIALLWGSLLIGMIVQRAFARRLTATFSPPERILLIGSSDLWLRLQSRFERGHALNVELVGRVAIEPRDSEVPAPLGPLSDLDFVLRSRGVERVIIAAEARTADEQLDVIRVVKGLGVKVSVLPRLFEVVGSSMEFDDVDGITLLGLRRYGLSRTSWYVKRTLDVTAAGLGVLLCAPLLGAIAVAVKLSSPGPVMFHQPRVGRRGQTFQMMKFRTMYDGADLEKSDLRGDVECDGLFKLVEDPRVTRVGRLLRRTSLDELPQLFNVLRGEMSLVGPRPLVEEEDRLIAGWHHRRREGTPGMTGVWQVLGSARVPLEDMVKMDYLYRANWSLWLDIKILLRTFAHVFARRGL
jgi:exopolysaccharide biosynthesis polyprenyl glycosylphosphotransferase